MRVLHLLGAAAILLTPLAAARPAEAKSQEWLRRDRETIRRLNNAEIRKVRRRDAIYAQQAAVSQQRQADYQRARQRHAEDQRRYEQDMAAWRRAVAACRRGVRSACGG